MNFRVRIISKLVFIPVVIAVMGGVVMFLWNNLVPGLFADAHSIDFVHAIGLLILCRILFGGFGAGRGGWGRHHRFEKWQSMTPEEREKVRERIKTHRGGWHAKWHDKFDQD